MRRLLSGCLKLVLLPVLLAVILLAMIGAGVTYFWAARRLLEPAPLVSEVTELGLIRDKLLTHQLKPVRQALLEKQSGQFDLKLDDKELTALVGSNLPPWLGPIRVELGLETDNLVDLRFSRKWNEDKWLNLDGQASVKAEQGDFNVQIRKLRLGTCDCPGVALGQLSHLLELVLEKDPSLAHQPWRIPDFHVERGRVRLRVETWPK
ncbi:MAG: hypothetical protein A2V67_04395 [Deltaproteobacteria bacterium RBG_13_61_14]|nr:MAG: hypothetical protein A2V67_04395 [Deltaproteobacteria bacterium RBG_13_61_14]